jgi:hypothetical protein
MKREQILERYSAHDPELREALGLVFELVDKLHEAGATESEALELALFCLQYSRSRLAAGLTDEEVFAEIAGKAYRHGILSDEP